ncbi:long-chain fatty acid--CoA ligase [Candidatus Cyanaurora vandensis]|uniref:long-chain-fatty-acid--CoA ligase n=1 Tax=Candidatus Cyanaurora vandensis TaxID=2714958 RepID=UPI00257A4A15|nr:long-chain fatty acid--CoA ligase [Candidatus Cyanaurora vandensis]
MNLATLLDRVAQEFPEHPALVTPDQTLSYRQLQQQSAALAGGLRDLGIRAGDRVAVMLPNILPFPVTVYGLWRLGAELVTLNPLLKPQEVAHILQDSGAVALVTLGPLLAALQEVLKTFGGLVIQVGDQDPVALPYSRLLTQPPLLRPHPVAPEDVVAVLYTSGTTGRPKGAMLTSHNLDYDSAAAVGTVGVTPQDRLYCVLPLFHAYALNVALLVFLRAGASVFLESRFVPGITLRHLAEFNCTVFLGVPALFGALLTAAQGVSLAGLRFCISGGAPLPVETLRAFEAKFQTLIIEGDGPTECSPITTLNPLRGQRKIGSVGLPLQGQQMVIVDPVTDQVVTVPGQVGEIVVRGPNVFKGYLNQPEATAQVLRNGGYHTGDLGYLDEDGYLFIVDRLKDLILVGGLNVYSREVEEVIHQHSAVVEAAVVGDFDAVKGESVHAFIQLQPETSLTSLQIIQHCRQFLADYKCPRQVTFLPELPRSATGKVLKRVLKEGLKGHSVTELT